MVKVLIIADDETGMLDTGAPFAKRGIRTEALTGELSAEVLKQCKASVAVINTKTRHVPVEQAYETVRKAAEAAVEAGVELIYKKTDSALRGHVGTELAAVMDAAGDQMFFFPAYPEAGRTTVRGIQYANGVPISESVFAGDELNPMKESYIPALIRESADVPVRLAGNIRDWQPEKTDRIITVFEGGCQEEFQETIKLFLEKCTPRLVAGCAGLANELADRMNLTWSGNMDFPEVKKLFVVCGSSNPITREQLDYAQENGFVRFTLRQKDLMEGEQFFRGDGKLFLSSVRKACGEGTCVILDMEYIDFPVMGQPELTKQQLGERIVTFINEVLRSCMDVLDDYTLFLTGGDTLSGFIRMSGCDRIRVLGELSPGIAVNLFRKGETGRYVISKSGGFGNREVLLDCLKERGNI